MLACAVVKTTAAQSLAFVYNALRMSHHDSGQGGCTKVKVCCPLPEGSKRPTRTIRTKSSPIVVSVMPRAYSPRAVKVQEITAAR
jgi:hypothetical protein